MCTQDIVYSCLVTIGIFSLIKTKSNSNKFYILLFGVWIGLAFMMKTFLVAVPLVSLFPYLITKKNILSSTFFWFGLIIGFLPFLFWAYFINSYLDQNIIFYLFNKFNFLANKNSFTNPFYYYFWNIPITFLPWSLFSNIGLIANFLENKNQKFILTYFPLILILIISFFSTKTPYYPLQLSAIFSLNSYLGIKYLFNSKNYKFLFIFITSKLIPLLIISLTFVYYFFLKYSLNLNAKENMCVISGLILFALAWSQVKSKNTLNEIIITLIIGPYLLTSLLLHSGIFTDRSRELREAMEYLSSLDILKNEIIKVDKSGISDDKSQSKIIRISLLTPNLGNGINSIESLKASEYAWSTFSTNNHKSNDSYQIIYDDEILSPWKLIKKNQ